MMKTIHASLLVSAAVLFGIAVLSTNARGQTNFVPNDQKFWDNSENWTTDYGPAYRDTVLQAEDMVPCNGPFALCFTSGPEPLPCVPTKDGRFANCTCTAHTGLNFVLISAILNFEVWLDTVAFCSSNDCTKTDAAPVCAAIKSGKLIKGADLISTFDPSSRQAVIDILEGQKPLVCPKAPYAACMTAPCKQKKGENPVCSCPVFNGVFQLPTPGAVCDPGDNLIPSSSFSPTSLNP
jgi:hypothetical protein